MFKAGVAGRSPVAAVEVTCGSFDLRLHAPVAFDHIPPDTLICVTILADSTGVF